MNYKEDMLENIEQLFTDDRTLQEKAIDYKDKLFNTEIYQDFNPLFHEIRKHKLEILDEIIKECEL